ncbi:MAG: tetratricopeptide repeat protein [Cyclobacteriaceae bacterium]
MKGLGFLTESNTERLQYYFEALEIRKELNDSLGIGISLYDIGTVYRSLGELEKGIDYSTRGLDMRRKIKDYGGIAQSLIEFGHIAESEGSFTKALNIYKESLVNRLKAGEINGIAYSHINLASAFANLRQCDSAFFFCDLAEKEFARANNLTISNWISWIRGHCYHETHQTVLALAELKEVESVSVHYLRSLLEVAVIYEEMQDFKNALEYQKKWIAENKISEERLNAKAARELAADYEYKIQQNEIERKNETEKLAKKRQDNLQLMLIAIGLIAAFMFIVSLRKQFSERTVNVLTFVGFMFLFEFIVVLLDPSLQNWSGNKPLFLLLGNTVIALIIAPLHSFVEKYFKKKMRVNSPETT